MALEIEHKYLVKDYSFKNLVEKRTLIRQGYLSKEKERTVRVRVKGDKGFITIKGKNNGDTRAEYEYPIPVQDANEMLDNMCLYPIIEKYRNIVVYDGNTWEIDEFQGALKGLVLAEIEIPCSEYKYDIPSFIGKNVTNDVRYYNSNLSDKVPSEE